VVAPLTEFQEFTIEIPDAEADEIKTVQQGKCSPRLAILPGAKHSQLSTTSPKPQKVRQQCLGYLFSLTFIPQLTDQRHLALDRML